MAIQEFNGPVIPTGERNRVLRGVLFHSTVARAASRTNYHEITLGIREGDYTSWIGTWSGSSRDVEAGEGVSLLDRDRANMRLRPGYSFVVKVESVGTPVSIDGSRVNFRMSSVGRQHGRLAPLVSGGSTISDPTTRDAALVMERQINRNLSSWVESVEITDPVALVTTGTFEGRLQRDDATTISLQRYTGNWVEVDGDALSITSSGLSRTASDYLLESTGGVGTNVPVRDTLYYVYVGVDQIRLSATAPSSYLGTLYLGTTENAKKWRFCGWVWMDASVQFNDSETAREVVNYYNRRESRLYIVPGYSDNNAVTSYGETTTSWAAINSGTNAEVSFIANAEDIVRLFANMTASSDTNLATYGTAIGIDGATDIETAGLSSGAAGEVNQISVPRAYAPSTAGRHRALLLTKQSAGTTTVYADIARDGADADVATTFLVGWLRT